LKYWIVVAVNPSTVTESGPFDTPAGTATVRVVAVALSTGTIIPLKETMLLPAVGEKLLPVMVTKVPTGPLLGLTEVIVGGAALAWCDPKHRIKSNTM